MIRAIELQIYSVVCKSMIRANKTKRELMDCHTRRKYILAHADLTKFVNDCVSRKGCRINTT